MRRATYLALGWPRAVLGGWLALVVCLALLGTGVESRLTQSILEVPGTESSRAIKLAKREFGESVTVPVLLQGPADEIDRQGPVLVRFLSRRPDVRVLSPWDRAVGSQRLRPREEAAMIVVAIDRPYREAFDEAAPRLREQIEGQIEPPLVGRVTGLAAIGNGLKEESYAAARRAEMIAVPILIIVLLLVFRSPLAAAVPAFAGLSTVLASFGALWVLASIWPIDPIATSLASMMGLALGVDYSLLLVSRFREELQEGRDPLAAAATAGETAGRTVLFAAAALVAAMLVALLLSPGDLLLSAAIGVITATALSVGAAVLAMPAALLLAGRNIDRWRLGRSREARRPAWIGLLGSLLRRPGLAAALILLPLLALATPTLALETGPPDVRQLPADNEARRDFEAVRKVMGPGWGAPFDVIVAAPRGEITDPERLSQLERWQGRISRLPGVSFVVGPGRLAREAEGLAGTERRLARGEQGLKRLSEGLGEASSGLRQLRDGLAEATSAAQAIGTGAGTAAEQAARLEGALAAGTTGARRISAALGKAAQGAKRLRRGAGKAAAGAARISSRLDFVAARVGKQFVPGAEGLAAGLERGIEGLGKLQQPAQLGEQEVRKGFDSLQAMTVGRADPRYQEAIEAIGRGYAAISGRDPRTGLPVRPDYQGLSSELTKGEEELRRAAAGASRLARGSVRLASGLERLAGGADELAAGVERLRSGNARLASGLGRLSEESTGFSGAVTELGSGADRLVGGLERLGTGGARLSSGLDSGYRRSGRLDGGLERLDQGAARIHGRYAFARRRQQRRSPGLFDSGYFVLAGLDGARRRQREQASFAVNFERGGEAGRVMVIPTSGPNDPATAALRERLSEAGAELAEQTDTVAAVGGPAAQLADYDAATSSRLLWLVLALGLVTFLVLVPIFRSVVLALIAVALNMLTVAASFGMLSLLFGGSDPLLGGPGYIDAVAISAIYTVIFGLSIDYEVFLITRMREGWLESGETDRAIAYGLERTASVVTGAAAIMTGVFLAFALTPVTNTRQFGVGLTIAVLLDATVVRLVLLPAVMRRVGERCWWMPDRLDLWLPEMNVEGEAHR